MLHLQTENNILRTDFFIKWMNKKIKRKHNFWLFSLWKIKKKFNWVQLRQKWITKSVFVLMRKSLEVSFLFVFFPRSFLRSLRGIINFNPSSTLSYKCYAQTPSHHPRGFYVRVTRASLTGESARSATAIPSGATYPPPPPTKMTPTGSAGALT